MQEAVWGALSILILIIPMIAVILFDRPKTWCWIWLLLIPVVFINLMLSSSKPDPEMNESPKDDLPIKESTTGRGFHLVEFIDKYGSECSLQKSSLATEDAIWFGINDANPQLMAYDAKKLGIKTEQNSGWVKYPIPDEVLLNTRMHLTQEQVKKLIPYLQRFVDTGEILE